LLLLATGFVYWNSLEAPFVFDDVHYILHNELIRDLSQPWQVISCNPARALLLLSFAVNWALSGGQTFGFHLTNLAIHLLNAYLVFRLLGRLLAQRPALQRRMGRYGEMVPSFGALLFTVHPLQTEAVTYIVGRSSSMAALFYLLALHAFLEAAQTEGRRRAVWIATTGALYLLGLTAKEIVATLPAALLLLDAEGVLRLPVGETGLFGAQERLVALDNLAQAPEPGYLPRFHFALELDAGEPPVLYVPVAGGLRVYRRLLADGGQGSELLRVRQRYRYSTDPGASRGKRNFAFQIQTFIPEVRVGDRDGDGRNELFFLWEDEVEVFTRGEDGRFRSEPVAYQDLDVETRKEKEERNAWVQPQLDDLQGDGVADLVLMKVSGSMLAMRSSVYVFPGRKGGGFDPVPAQQLQRTDFTPAVLFADANGDGAKDLVVASVEIGVAAMFEVLTKRRVTVDFNVHLNRGGRFTDAPDTTVEVPFHINLAGGADIRSAPPVFGRDFDGDGITDLLYGEGPEALVIHRGTRAEGEGLFEDHFRVRLEAPTSPWMAIRTGRKQRMTSALVSRCWVTLTVWKCDLPLTNARGSKSWSARNSSTVPGVDRPASKASTASSATASARLPRAPNAP